ncbi:nucleoside-diphosphate kinase [Fibrobacterota bacterium]
MEYTLVMIKPNGVANGLIGKIINRYETSRLSISAIKIKHLSQKEAEGFYAEHVGKDFFARLVAFMISGPSILMVLHGHNAIEAVRVINGATSPKDAMPGTIRYDYAPDERKNLVHSSDSTESAKREIAYWFSDEDIVAYAPHSFICKELDS